MTSTASRMPWSRSGPAEDPGTRPHEFSPGGHGATSLAPDESPTRRSVWTRVVLGKESDPRWARPGLLVLLGLSALLYCWNLTNSGYANEFYAAAVKSGTHSWTAWFFGSLDSANAITVDKPPASLWVMGLSARLFGFSSFSLLLPQALMGVGTVALTYATVRRWSGAGAGLLAGALVAATPVAALMFRFDNPDAMLVLLMTAAAYTVTRAVDSARARTALGWIVGAGVLIGFAFLTKMLQGLLVLPGMGLAYLVAARFSLRTRLMHLVAATAGVVVGAGWLVVVEALWPAASRPYIGGSTNNSLWDLAIGYNGLGRLLGGSGNGGGGGGAGAGGGGFGGNPGLLRMFNSQFGAEISWFLPAALLLLVAGLLARGRAARTDRVRAALIMWGGWLLVTTLCLSFMKGTVHSYYAVALAPAIAACIAIGAREAWARRDALAWRLVLAVSIVVTAAWSFTLLADNASTWMPWLRWVTLVAAVVGALVFVVARRRASRLGVAGLFLATVTAFGGSTAWTVATAATGHTGSMPVSGPAVAGGQGHGGAPGAGGGPGGMTARSGGNSASAGKAGKSGSTPGNAAQGSRGAMPQGGAKGAMPGGGTPPQGGTGGAPGGTPPQGGQAPGNASGGNASGANAPGGTSAGGTTSGGTASGQSGAASKASSAQPSGGQGQPGGGTSNNAALTKLLNATSSRWSAAVIGDQSAAGYILSSDTAVMSIGGWSGSDNNVTLAQFEQYVKAGDIHYFIAGGGMGGPGGNNGSSAQITAWVKAHFKATSVGGVTVYDLTKATS